MTTCPSCGREVSADAYGCPHCGYTFDDAEAIDDELDEHWWTAPVSPVPGSILTINAEGGLLQPRLAGRHLVIIDDRLELRDRHERVLQTLDRSAVTDIEVVRQWPRTNVVVHAGDDIIELMGVTKLGHRQLCRELFEPT